MALEPATSREKIERLRPDELQGQGREIGGEQADNKGRAKGGNLPEVKSCIPDNPQRRKQTCGKSPSSPSTPAFQHKARERAWGEPRGVIRNDKVLRYIQDASSRHTEIHV